MLGQLNIHGKDKVQVAIERLKTFEPPEGYYLAFSGGKDSVVIKALADMAGVKYDAHYTLTSVDPPELVQFVKTFKDVSIDKPRDKDGKQITMWNLIPKNGMPPTRIVRYCCHALKETQSRGRFTITGVRKAESVKRAKRGGLELAKKVSQYAEQFDPDNPDQELIHICHNYAIKFLNPIIDWTTEEVWEFIHTYNVPYCKLYDEGFTRLGCIGCPMGGGKGMAMEFERYPKYRRMYIRAFEKMLEARGDNGKSDWKTGEEVMDWWMHGGTRQMEEVTE